MACSVFQEENKISIHKFVKKQHIRVVTWLLCIDNANRICNSKYYLSRISKLDIHALFPKILICVILIFQCILPKYLYFLLLRVILTYCHNKWSMLYVGIVDESFFQSWVLILRWQKIILLSSFVKIIYILHTL